MSYIYDAIGRINNRDAGHMLSAPSKGLCGLLARRRNSVSFVVRRRSVDPVTAARIAVETLAACEAILADRLAGSVGAIDAEAACRQARACVPPAYQIVIRQNGEWTPEVGDDNVYRTKAEAAAVMRALQKAWPDAELKIQSVEVGRYELEVFARTAAAAAAFGRRGGMARGGAKARAARENGRRGGRPPMRHLPAPGTVGLEGPALCGRWAQYATGDHRLVRRLARLALADGQSGGYCRRCLSHLSGTRTMS